MRGVSLYGMGCMARGSEQLFMVTVTNMNFRARVEDGIPISVLAFFLISLEREGCFTERE